MPKPSLCDKITVTKPLVPGQFVRCVCRGHLTWLVNFDISAQSKNIEDKIL